MLYPTELQAPVFLTVKCNWLVSRFRLFVPIRPMLNRGSLCNGLQQPALLVEPTHRILEPLRGRVQVGAGLFQVHVPQHLLHVVNWPTRRDPA